MYPPKERVLGSEFFRICVKFNFKFAMSFYADVVRKPAQIC